MWNKAIRGALVVALLLILALPVEAGREASVGGTIIDENGEKLEGVLVTVFSDDETRTDTTNKKGRFRLMVMDATVPFKVRLEKEGYQSQEGPLQLNVGAALNLTWTMAPASATQPMEGTNEAVTFYNDGATAFNAGDYPAARTHFEAALELMPEMLAAHKVLTLVYFQQQEWALALASAEKVIVEEPENESALKIGFDAAGRAGDDAKAAQFLDRLAEVAPDADTAARVFNLGVAEMRAENIEAAKMRFEQAIAIAPELGAAYNGLATLHLRSEEYDEALAMADRLLAVDPGNTEALGIRYEVYRLTGDEEKMQAALDELQSADPERIVDAFFQQGVLMFNQGNPEAAIEAFQRVLTAAPDHARAYYEIGRAYLSSGDIDRAKEALQKFLEMAPNDPEAPSAEEMLGYLQ